MKYEISLAACARGMVVAVLFLGTPVWAQPPDAADPAAGAPADTPAVAPARAQPQEPDRWRFAWQDHPSLFFGKDTRIDFRLRLQSYLRDSDAEVGDAPGEHPAVDQTVAEAEHGEALGREAHQVGDVARPVAGVPDDVVPAILAEEETGGIAERLAVVERAGG